MKPRAALKPPETWRGMFSYFKRAARMLLYFKRVRDGREEAAANKSSV
jgi:hypothetical protein